MKPGRYAAIDIGTVTCRLLVADVDSAGRLTVIAKEREFVNLGEGVDATRRISEAAMARAAAAIDKFLNRIEELTNSTVPLMGLSVMATSASRDAENADEFKALLASRGLSMDVIPGEMEAALSFIGATATMAATTTAATTATATTTVTTTATTTTTTAATATTAATTATATTTVTTTATTTTTTAANTDEKSVPVMVVDSGGGSTEVAIGFAGRAPAEAHSYNIGCRRVTEKFMNEYPPAPESVQAAREWIREQFANWPIDTLVHPAPSVSANLVAVAGTATSAVTIRDRITEYDPAKVSGQRVTAGQLQEILDYLLSLSLPELEAVPGLEPRRAPVIAAGMLILDELLRITKLGHFTVSESDILEGMIMYNSIKMAQ